MKIAVMSLMLTVAPAAFAAQPVSMPVVTITDIGKPYTIVSGDCKWEVLFDTPLNFNGAKGVFENATNKAVNDLVQAAQKLGGNAIVGLQIVNTTGTTGNSSVGTLNGILACGTIVKANE